jgi:hypothetical protein
LKEAGIFLSRLFIVDANQQIAGVKKPAYELSGLFKLR